MSFRTEIALRILVIALPLCGLAVVLALRPVLWQPVVVFSSPKVAAHGFLTISIGGLCLYGAGVWLRANDKIAAYLLCSALGIVFACLGFFLALTD